jgi:carbon monoxide dehydrogenase subunit G
MSALASHARIRGGRYATTVGGDRAMRTALALTCGFGLLIAAGAARAETVETSVSARVAAPPDRVLAVLADFESWGRVFASVETLGAERQDDRRARVRQRVHRAGYTFRYTLAATVDRAARRVDLELDPNEPSDMETLATTWRVEPLDDGGALVTLRVRTRSRLPIPAFLERHITQRTASESIAELVRALERVASAERVGNG